ncbi:MAG TPA: hypothetical protein DEF16_18700 [Gemmobacter sp.]|nr:hypothetical protein [Gemmobacter sp.]HBU16576.1 hypothetical protein [Gemmobacter sp.]
MRRGEVFWHKIGKGAGIGKGADRALCARRRNLPGPEGRGRSEVVSAAGFEPTAPGFIPLRLSPPPFGVRGLDCPFTICPKALRCCPSSLYTFPLAGAWLGIGKAQAP